MGIIAFNPVVNRGGVQLDRFRHLKLNKCLDAETIIIDLSPGLKEYEWIHILRNMELTSQIYTLRMYAF